MDAWLVPLLLGGWLLASAWGGQHLVTLLEGSQMDPAWRLVVQILTFAVLLPLPLADELIAKPRFEALCRERARLEIHLPEALGPRAQRLRLLPETVKGLGVPVVVQPWWVVVEGGGLVAASYETVQARGGWLARWTRPEDPERGPLTFQGLCEPPDLEGRLQPRQPQAPHGATIGQADEVTAPEQGLATPVAAPAGRRALRQL